jgi:tetratricopeptide (TPR) repeat protein
MGKDPEITAKNQLQKAEQLYRARQFKKAGKNFHSAGNSFLKLEEFEMAKNCFLEGVKTFIELEKYDTVIELLRQACEASLQNNQYKEAYQLYKDTLNYIPKLKSEGDKNYNNVLFSFLAYLCLHATGSPEEGLDYIKRNRNKIDNDFFKENEMIQLISELTLSLRDKTEKYLEKIKNNLNQLKLRDPEVKLLKDVLLLTKFQLLIESSLILDKGTYTTNDNINLNLELDTNSLIQVVNDSFFKYKISTFQIIKLIVNLSDNLTTNKKPNLPLSINFGSKISLPFTLKPHFQLDDPNIGPIILTFELNNLLIFNYETPRIIPNLISPPATLEASIKNLRPPLLDQTFPLEILIENMSHGEALDVKVDVEFPDELKIMRGTTDKQIYSLKTNENLKWEVNLKPLEVGDYIIKINIKFKDPDDNQINDIKEFPFSIKM